MAGESVVQLGLGQEVLEKGTLLILERKRVWGSGSERMVRMHRPGDEITATRSPQTKSNCSS